MYMYLMSDERWGCDVDLLSGRYKYNHDKVP